VVCAADGDGDVQIVEPPESAKKGAPLTLVLRTKRNKSFEVETTTVCVWPSSAPQHHQWPEADVANHLTIARFTFAVATRRRP
jgi:hypothetical protein